MSAERRTDAGGHQIETRIGRVLGIGTLAAVILLAVGSVALLADGRSPLDPAPALDPARLLDELIRLQSAPILWLGLLVVVVTPAARVVAAGGGFLGRGERAMAVVAVLILVVIAAGVAAGTIGA